MGDALSARPRESGDPGYCSDTTDKPIWIPACAGMSGTIASGGAGRSKQLQAAQHLAEDFQLVERNFLGGVIGIVGNDLHAGFAERTACSRLTTMFSKVSRMA